MATGKRGMQDKKPNDDRGGAKPTNSEMELADKDTMPPAPGESIGTLNELLALAREETRAYRTFLLASITIFFAVPITNLSLEHPEFLRRELWGNVFYLWASLIIVPWLVGSALMSWSLKRSLEGSLLSGRRIKQAASFIRRGDLNKGKVAIVDAIGEEISSTEDFNKLVRHLSIGVLLFGVSLGAELMVFLYWALILQQ